MFNQLSILFFSVKIVQIKRIKFPKLPKGYRAILYEYSVTPPTVFKRGIEVIVLHINGTYIRDVHISWILIFAIANL